VTLRALVAQAERVCEGAAVDCVGLVAADEDEPAVWVADVVAGVADEGTGLELDAGLDVLPHAATAKNRVIIVRIRADLVDMETLPGRSHG
jgi:hypothetical protein